MSLKMPNFNHMRLVLFWYKKVTTWKREKVIVNTWEKELQRKVTLAFKPCDRDLKSNFWWPLARHYIDFESYPQKVNFGHSYILASSSIYSVWPRESGNDFEVDTAELSNITGDTATSLKVRMAWCMGCEICDLNRVSCRCRFDYCSILPTVTIYCPFD